MKAREILERCVGINYSEINNVKIQSDFEEHRFVVTLDNGDEHSMKLESVLDVDLVEIVEIIKTENTTNKEYNELRQKLFKRVKHGSGSIEEIEALGAAVNDVINEDEEMVADRFMFLENGKWIIADEDYLRQRWSDIHEREDMQDVALLTIIKSLVSDEDDKSYFVLASKSDLALNTDAFNANQLNKEDW